MAAVTTLGLGKTMEKKYVKMVKLIVESEAGNAEKIQIWF